MIIKNEYEVREKTFEELNTGDAFMFSYFIFVKIEEITTTDEDGITELYNAVRLSDGSPRCFRPATKITIPKVEVVVTK